jgi:hypothetical protein
LTSLPTKVKGFPFIVMIPVRSFIGIPPSGNAQRE